jgi:TonB family protein
MGHEKVLRTIFVFLAGAWAPMAGADLYQASAAAEKGDFARAFPLYRELAELGLAAAQETLAVMYVNGHGMPRDNILGYAWAKLALEQEPGRQAARTIVAELEPHLGDAARARIAEVHAQFGLAALNARLLPDANPPAPDPEEQRCRMKAGVDPDLFYPVEAKRRGISGEVLVEARVAADGSVRVPRAWYSFPAQMFEEAGRAVALNSKYTPATEKGVFVPCAVRFKVKFAIQGFNEAKPTAEAMRIVEELRTQARQGDPHSQLTYGLVRSLRPEFKPETDTTDWFLRAAQAGVPAAQYLVGLRLASSHGGEAEQAKGVRWLELGANGGSGGAMTALASYLLGSGQATESRNQGFEWMQRASRTSHREGKFLFAALLVSWPDAARRDPARALALVDEVKDAFDYDPLISEIRAAAFAAQGDFKKAQRAQSRAAGIAAGLNWNTGAHLDRLRAYEQGRLLEQELVSF